MLKLIIYYSVIFLISTVLYLTAEKAKKNGRNFTAYLCYFGIFVEVLILI